jgi:hypothetical protein
MQHAEYLKRAPEPARVISFDRVEGMLLGLAIGDALGVVPTRVVDRK